MDLGSCRASDRDDRRSQCGAALVVRGAVEAPRDAGVDDDERDGVERQRQRRGSSSDRQSSSSAAPVHAERGGELVHQAAPDADMDVLGTLRDAGQRHPVGGGSLAAGQGPAR